MWKLIFAKPTGRVQEPVIGKNMKSPNICVKMTTLYLQSANQIYDKNALNIDF